MTVHRSSNLSSPDLARLYEEQGYDARALAHYQKLFESDPENPAYSEAVDRLTRKCSSPGARQEMLAKKVEEWATLLVRRDWLTRIRKTGDILKR